MANVIPCLPAFQKAAALNCHVPVVVDNTDGAILFASLFMFQTIFFSLRVASRLLHLASWGLDDTTIVISWVSVVPPVPRV